MIPKHLQREPIHGHAAWGTTPAVVFNPPKPAARPDPKPRPAVKPAPGGLGKAAQGVLDALAQWQAWGFTGATAPQLALLAGYHPRTKGYLNGLSQVRAAGYVETDGGLTKLTAAGKKLAKDAYAAKSEIFKRVWEQADGAARKIMEELRAKALTRDDLAAALKVHPRTKGHLNAISWLNALTVIKKDGDNVRLNDWVLGVRA